MELIQRFTQVLADRYSVHAAEQSVVQPVAPAAAPVGEQPQAAATTQPISTLQQALEQQQQEREEKQKLVAGLSNIDGAHGLKNPGKWDEMSKEHKETTMLDMYEGCRFEVQKTIQGGTPGKQFMLLHQFSLGNPENGGTSYDIGAVLGHDVFGSLNARLSSTGIVQGRGIWRPIRDRLEAHCQFAFVPPPIPSPSQVVGDVDVFMPSYTMNFKLGGSDMVCGISFLKQLTSSISAGTLLEYNGCQRVAHITGQARAELTKDNILNVHASTNGAHECSYTRKIGDQLNLTTAISYNQKSNESSWLFGYLYQFRLAAFRGMISGEGRALAHLESQLGQTPFRLSFCGDLNHAKNEHKFGVGLSLLA